VQETTLPSAPQVFRASAGLYTAAMPPTASSRVIAVVLAAGRSTRFKSGKQLAGFGGRPLVRHALDSLDDSGVDATVLVAGHDCLDVHAAAHARFLLINDAFADGMAVSIARATRALRQTADALLFCLADQPLIPASHYGALVRAWDGSATGIVATRSRGIIGAPALFGSALFGDLETLTGDSGARRIIERAGDAVVAIDCEEAALDVDTPADLAAATRRRDSL
jgi:CTP:molybdopterin cytidylyltransferase MocA